LLRISKNISELVTPYGIEPQIFSLLWATGKVL
jgi:hypothetical protein